MRLLNRLIPIVLFGCGSYTPVITYDHTTTVPRGHIREISGQARGFDVMMEEICKGICDRTINVSEFRRPVLEGEDYLMDESLDSFVYHLQQGWERRAMPGTTGECQVNSTVPFRECEPEEIARAQELYQDILHDLNP